MKKLMMALVATAALLAAKPATNALAIEHQDRKGTLTGTAQVGFLPGIGALVAGDYVLVDQWWKGHFTVGGQLGYSFRNLNSYYWGYSVAKVWRTREHHINFLARATYGLNITKKFEVHVGALAGLCVNPINQPDYYYYEYYDNVAPVRKTYTHCHFSVGGLGGLRFWVTPKLALTADVMGVRCGSSTFTAGIAWKM